MTPLTRNKVTRSLSRVAAARNRSCRAAFPPSTGGWVATKSGGGSAGMMVEIECLYTSCEEPSRRSSSEKASNQVMTPWSLTPLTRKMVTGCLARRTLFRKWSCRLSDRAAIEASLFLPLPLVPDTKGLEFAVQCGAFHADERRGARDVARKTADLNLQILALEGFAGFPQGAAHDRHRVRRATHGALIVENLGRQQVDVDASDAVARRENDRPFDDISQLANVARPVVR